MQIRKANGNIITVTWFEDRLIELRLNQADKNGYMKPMKKKVIMFEPELLPSLIEGLTDFYNERRLKNDSNRQPAGKIA